MKSKAITKMFSNLEMCVQCKLLVEPPKFSLQAPPKLDLHSIDGLVDLLQLNNQQLKVIELISENKCKLDEISANSFNIKTSKQNVFELDNRGKLILCLILITILIIISIIFVLVVRHLRKNCVKLAKELNYLNEDFEKNDFQISEKNFSSHYHACENEPPNNNYYQRVYEELNENFSNTISNSMQQSLKNSKPASPSLISNESSVASTKSLIGSSFASNVNTSKNNANMLIIRDYLNACAIPNEHQYFQVLSNGHVNSVAFPSNDINTLNAFRTCNLNFNVHELPNVLLMTS